MRCLLYQTIITINAKAIKEHGGSFGIRDLSEIIGLKNYTENTSSYYNFNYIEKICLATYQIIKRHPFIDGNKRTAFNLILNCLRSQNLKYTGRLKDLAYKIENIAMSNPKNKDNAVSDLAYFIKSHLQKR